MIHQLTGGAVVILALLLLMLLTGCAGQHAVRGGPTEFAAVAFDGDPRICYRDVSLIPRRADGSIARSAAAVATFRRWWACPSTQEFSGSCPDWEVDHDRPLAIGGCDAPHNMSWMHKAIKRCSREKPNNKDCWERDVYAPGRYGVAQ